MGLGESRAAREAFEQAVAYEPTHQNAMRYLRMIEEGRE